VNETTLTYQQSPTKSSWVVVGSVVPPALSVCAATLASPIISPLGGSIYGAALVSITTVATNATTWFSMTGATSAPSTIHLVLSSFVNLGTRRSQLSGTVYAYPVEVLSSLSLPFSIMQCPCGSTSLAPQHFRPDIVSVSPNGDISSVGCGLIPAQIGCKEFKDIHH